MICQYSSIFGNKGTTLVQDVNSEGDCAYLGAGSSGKFVYFPLTFAVNLKLLSKIGCIFKKFLNLKLHSIFLVWVRWGNEKTHTCTHDLCVCLDTSAEAGTGWR